MRRGWLRMTIHKKEFYIVELKNYKEVDEDQVEILRENIIEGLTTGLRYISIISPEGVNRAEEEGHTTDNIEISEYLIVLNDEDEIDIEKTAALVVEDMLLNGMLICMRNVYEEIKDTNGCWIDKILEDDDA